MFAIQKRYDFPEQVRSICPKFTLREYFTRTGLIFYGQLFACAWPGALT